MPQQFDVNAARQAGATDDQILGYLAQRSPNFDVQGALKQAPKAEIISYLSTHASPPGQTQSGQQSAEEQPSFMDRLTAPYDPGAAEFAEKHPILGPAVRFASAAGGAVLGFSRGIYHAVTDELTPQEEQEFKGHTRIPGEVTLERLTGAPLVRGAEQYVNPETRPTLKQAASVLPEALGTGTGTAVAAELAGRGVRAAKELGSRAILFGKTPKGAYQSALKPSTRISPAKTERMISTGLEENIPVSKAGVEKISGLIDDLNDQIAQKIGIGKGVTVDPYKVASRLNDTRAKFATQVNPKADLDAISEAGNEFLTNNPQPLPAAEAQAMKQGTYAQLKGKAYGELKSASIEAQKALARGIKEELANQFPELSELNAREGGLLDLQPVLEKAVQRIGNHQIMGIGTPITAGAAKVVTGSNKVGAVAGLMKAVLDNPAVKSKLAIALNQAGVPGAEVSARILAVANGLGEAARPASSEGSR